MAQIGKPQKREDVQPLVEPKRVGRPEKAPAKPSPSEAPKRRELVPA
jgi:hypothetical protein